MLDFHTVKEKTDTLNLDKLADFKQSPRDSIYDYGEKLFQMIKRMFPTMENSDDIDRLSQERFVEGLLNQRLREKVRSKMLKMRNILNDKNFKFYDLVKYAECKEASYDSNNYNSKLVTSSDSDAYQNQNTFNQNLQTYNQNQSYQNNSGQKWNGNTNYYKNKRFNNYRPRNDYQREENNYQSNFQQNFPTQTNQQTFQNQPQQNSNKVHFNETVTNKNQSEERICSVEEKESELKTVIMSNSQNSQIGRVKPIEGQAIFNNSLIKYMCDSGADRTIINENVYNTIKIQAPETKLEPANGLKMYSVTNEIRILGIVRLDRCIISPLGDLKYTEVVVTENISNYECLLGRDVINRVPELKQKLDSIHDVVRKMSNEVRKIYESDLEHRTKLFHESIKKESCHSEASEKLDMNALRKLLTVQNVDYQVNSLESKFNEHKQKNEPESIKHKIDQNNDTKNESELIDVREKISKELEKISAKSVLDLTPCKNQDVAFRIEFYDPNQKPIKCKCRPLPHNLKEKVFKEIKQQLQAGIIRRSKSPWCSPLRVVDKPDGSIRITVDYKPLNKLIKDDNYPLPSITDLYNKLAEADTFTKIDMKAAYHQIPVHPDSIEITAFVCEFGIFEYLSMPMGIKTAPAWFQRFIESALDKYIVNGTLGAYLDDTIVFTDSSRFGYKFHFDTVMDVINTLNNRSLKISFEKSVPAVAEVQLLGFTISKNQIKPNPDRAKCLVERGKPVTVKDLQSWLGVANYYRKFIKNYAEIAKPLYDLLGLKDVPKSCRKKNGAVDGKKVKLTWNKEAEDSFIKLQQTLCSDLVLGLTDFNETMILTTDACDYGYGSVLEQKINGEMRPLAYFSKNYTPSQLNYSTTEKELLSVVMSTEYFHQYLYGRKFEVHTDHLPLTWILKKSNLHKRLERWLLRLSLYDLEIFYKPGKENVVADMLSRLPDEDQVASEDNDYHDNLIAWLVQENLISFRNRGPEPDYTDINWLFKQDENKLKSGEESIEQFSIQQEDEYFKKLVAIVTEGHRQAESSIDDSSDESNAAENADLNGTQNFNLDNLDEEQTKDEDIQWIKNLKIQHGDKKPNIKDFENENRRVLFKQFENLIIVNNTLYRNSEDRNGFKITQLVLPKQISKNLINQIHSSLFNGHLGKNKTTSKITERFYRPFLKEDIKKCVKECEVCQKTKKTQPERRAELMYLTPCRPNQIVTTDITGPFKTTSRGNTDIQVVVDSFTKYLEFYPLKGTKAPGVATNLVDEWSCRYGIPEAVLSDGGKQFQSKLLDLTYDYLDIRKLKTTPYHPQCDGQSEKSIQTLKGMIRAYVDFDQTTWDLNLRKFAFAYNTSVHSITKQTPFEMMFGRRPRIPIDIILPNIDVLDRAPILQEYKILNEHGEVTVLEDVDEIIEANTPEVAKNYLAELKEKLKTCYETAAKNRNCGMEKAKIDHDRRLKKHEYKIGDLVLTDHPKLKKGLSHGLAHKYYGPFIIVGINENKCDYLLKLAGSQRAKIKQVHKNRLKAYFHSGWPLTSIKQEPEEDNTNKTKRKYNKNLSNPRWNKNNNQATCEKSSSDESNAESTENDEIRTNSKDSSDHSEGLTSFSEPESEPAKRQKPKKLLKNRLSRQNSTNIDNSLSTRKSTRDRQRPERYGF